MIPGLAFRRTGLALLGAGALGCGAESSADRDRPGVAASDTIRARPGVTIGVLEGDAAYAFGDITSVVADEAGRVYVADRIGSLVRVYGPDGGYLATIGREGEGPGEFLWPADLSFGPDGTLYVRDTRRITRLAPAVPGAIPDSTGSTWPIPGYGNTSSRRSAVAPDGRYFYPARRFPVDGTPQHFYLVFGGDGDAGPDTLRVPPLAGMESTMTAHYMVSAGTGRMVYGLSRAPFSPGPSWTVTPEGAVLSSEGRDYRLTKTDLAGDTAAVLSRAVAPRPVPDAEREDSARALAARIDSLEVPFDRLENVAPEIRDGVWPERLPQVLSIHSAADGSLWVGRWPPRGDPGVRVFDVLDPSGVLRGVVIVPAPLEADPPPFFTASGIYGVVEDPDTGVQRVRTLSFEW